MDRDLSYDQVARLTKIIQRKVTGDVDLDSYAYWYDKSSSPTRQQFITRSGSPSSSYSYDSLNRLSYGLYFDAANNGTEGFLYDDVGPPRADTYHKNRSGASVSYLADLVNAYTKIDSTARSYDQAGNLTDDGSYTYQWDHENRLTKIVRKSGSVTVAVLDYDALSRRVLKYDAVANSTLRFYYSDESRPEPMVTVPGWGDWRCIEEYDTSASPARQRYYLHGSTYIDELVWINNDVGTNTGTYYALQDHLFTTSALVNTSGSPIERYKYDAYGNVVFQDASFNNLVSQTTRYGNTYGFTGRRTDQMDSLALELMYYRVRFYDSLNGHFIARDPLGYIDALNLYQYVGSSPVCHLDPSGTDFYCYQQCSYEDPDEPGHWITDQDCYDVCATPPPPVPGPPNLCPPTEPGTATVNDGWCLDDAYEEGQYTYHRGAWHCYRSYSPPGYQCCYNRSGNLIPNGPGAGTADTIGPAEGDDPDGTCNWNVCAVILHYIIDVLNDPVEVHY